MYLSDIFGDYNDEISTPEQNEFYQKLLQKIADEMTKAAAPDPDDILLDFPEWYLRRKEDPDEEKPTSDE